MKQNESMELLAFMVSSAAGLRGEPAIYGPLRLIDAAKKLACMMAEEYPEKRQDLLELADLIESRRNSCMTDQEDFYALLDDASAKLVDCL